MNPPPVNPPLDDAARPDARLVELELRYTHLERTVHALNEAILLRERTLEDLARRLDRLTAQLETLTANWREGEPDEGPPPHY